MTAVLQTAHNNPDLRRRRRARVFRHVSGMAGHPRALDLVAVPLPWRTAKCPDLQSNIESGLLGRPFGKAAKWYARLKLIRPGSEMPTGHMAPLWAAIDLQCRPCWTVQIGGSARSRLLRGLATDCDRIRDTCTSLAGDS